MFVFCDALIRQLSPISCDDAREDASSWLAPRCAIRVFITFAFVP
jgi:hypothetical protein